jgi:ATP-dependent DNA helicase RecQ
LSKLQIIGYEPASEKPKVTFVVARQDAQRLTLNQARLTERRNLALAKSESMIDFVEQTRRCRMQVVLDYFDESSFETCGKCDVCMEKKKREDKGSFLEYEQRVNQLLLQKPMTVDELEQLVAPQDHHLFIEVVRELVDQGLIKYDEYWVLRKI